MHWGNLSLPWLFKDNFMLPLCVNWVHFLSLCAAGILWRRTGSWPQSLCTRSGSTVKIWAHSYPQSSRGVETMAISLWNLEWNFVKPVSGSKDYVWSWMQSGYATHQCHNLLEIENIYMPWGNFCCCWECDRSGIYVFCITCMPGGVIVDDSGLCCCVSCYMYDISWVVLILFVCWCLENQSYDLLYPHWVCFWQSDTDRLMSPVSWRTFPVLDEW